MSVSVFTSGNTVVLVQTETEDRVEVTTPTTETQVIINGSLPMPFPVPGPQGDDGGVNTFIAGEAIGSQKLVMLVGGKVFRFDQTDELNTYKVVGFSRTSVLINEEVEVVNLGLLESSGWGLLQDEIYYALGLGGITTTPPSTGISQAVGLAVDSDTLYVELNEPIIMI